MSIIGRIFGSEKSRPRKEMDLRMKVDVHSHLIPGIDDGVKTIEQSVEIIEELYGQGISKVITTPHVIYDLYPNSSERILEGEKLIREKLDEAGIPVEFKAAAEYYIDETFVQKHIKGNDKLLTIDGRHILVETNYVEKPGILEDVIFELILKGYKVVLAHPERYHYLLPDFNMFYKLKETGVLFQANLMSFTGHYDLMVKKAADFLLKEELIDMLGSDIHRIEHAKIIRQFKHMPKYERLMEFPLINKTLL